MLTQRSEQALALIQQKRRCSIEDLSSALGVSRVTVHRVLDGLESEGLVIKMRGGVRLYDPAAIEKLFDIRRRTNVGEKKQIAVRAADLVRPGDSLFLDASSTTCYLARELALRGGPPVTVVTNSLVVATEVARCPHLHLIVTGGELDYQLNALLGPLTLESLSRFQVDHAFVSAAGVSVERGAMTAQSTLADLLRTVVETASEVNLLMDNSKLGRVAPITVMPLARIRRLISDSRLAEAVRDEYRQAGLEVLT